MTVWKSAALLAIPCLSGCGSEAAEAAPGGASTSASASAPASGSAANADKTSQLHVALEGGAKIVLSRVEGGVVVADERGARMASAKTGGDLEERTAPAGLPKDVQQVQYVGGRLPDALWLSVALEPESGKKTGKTPFYRLTGSKLKDIADDWQPLVVPWSKKRTLAISTSSGKLKIKVIDPFTKTGPADQPARFVPDEECGKSLKLAEAVAFPTGEVLAAGRCSMGADKKSSHVVVRWAPAPAPATPAATAAPATPEPAPAGAEADASSITETKEDDEKKGVPMALVVVSTDKARHRALAARSPDEVYVAAAGDAAGSSRLYQVGKDQSTAVTLPAIEGAIEDLAVTENGELWLVTTTAAWRKPSGGDWVAVAPPTDVKLSSVVTSGNDVWIAGSKGEGKNARGLVLRASPTKKLEWK